MICGAALRLPRCRYLAAVLVLLVGVLSVLVAVLIAILIAVLVILVLILVVHVLFLRNLFRGYAA